MVTGPSHGLSYTTFSLSSLQISSPVLSEGDVKLTVSVHVENTGHIPGSQVIQVYTSLPKTSELTHPEAQLKGFRKISMGAGKSQSVEVALDKYAVSYWDEKLERWIVEAGEYDLRVGFSSDDCVLSGIFVIEKGLEWNGL